MPRINTDEIVREFGQWDNPSDVMKAGKMAVKKMNYYLAHGVSFNQETTLCGKSIFNNIAKAKSKGYLLEVHYVGVDNVNIAKERVRYRVQNGGHGIPEKDIERRYGETFQNLKRIMKECDFLTFYDNTIGFRRFAAYENGNPVMFSDDVPNWFEYVCK